MDLATDRVLVVRFGVFEADLRAGELRKGGIKVKVQDLPFRALKLFLSRPNQVISRKELRRALWPDDVFVDFDRGISSAINRLREALCDTADNPRFIETVARSGYRWIASTQVVTPVDYPLADQGIGARLAFPPPSLPSVTPTGSAWWKNVLTIVAGLAFLAGTAILLIEWQQRPVSRGPVVTAVPHQYTSSPEVEQLYLTGRYYWNKRTPDSLNQAVDFFSQAIVRDPNYSKPYVGLADSYNLLREFSSMPESEAYGRAFSAASKAAELDPSSAEAHASLGFIYFWSKRDLAASSREFQRAIALNPTYVDAYHWYGNILNSVGRSKEGLVYLKRAQQLEPASASILSDKGVGLVQAGFRDEGIALLRQIESADPNFSSPHSYLSTIYLGELNCPSYLTEARAHARLVRSADGLALVQVAEKGFASGGCAGMLRNILEFQKKRYAEHRMTAYALAETEALLGDQQTALQYLRLSLAQNETPLAQVRDSSFFEALHPTPEFRQLIRDAGLPPL